MYIDIHICILYDDFMRCHEDMVMLRNTTGSYGRPVLEVAYGETLFSLHQGSMRYDSSGRVVEVLTWCIAHVRHTRVNTSLGFVYVIFWFYDIKTICTMFLNIYDTKEHWWSLTLSWPDMVQRMFLTVHEFSNENVKPQTISWVYKKKYLYICTLWCYYIMFYLH